MLRLVLSIMIGASLLPAQTPDLTGRWFGTLDAGPAKLRLAFHFNKESTGAWKGTLDSLDQSVNGIPLGKVSFEGNQLSVEIPAVAGTYAANLTSTGQLEGKWTQGGASLPLSLVRSADAGVAKRPQEPKKPYPYNELEVTYENSLHKLKLAGTLSLPKATGKMPAVILITGSGPQNRNEELMGHKPFLILSDHLTRKGIAVLRVDDRGIGGSTGTFSESTTLDFATDVLSGIDFLKTRPEIDPLRIGLIGHSEGGLIAPIVASQSKDVAFIVMLAGTGVNGEEILYEQGAAILKASGATPAAIRAKTADQKKMFAVLRAEKDQDEARRQLEAFLMEEVAKLPEDQRLKAAGSLKAQLAQITSPWFRTFLTLDPAVFLRKVSCPVLAINGELDLQVLPTQNLPAIEKALRDGGNKDYTLERLPNLNHLFQTAKTGSPTEYASIEETISPAVLETIATWISQRTQKR